MAESAHNTSKAASGELVYSILGGTALNYIGYRACIHGASAGASKYWNHVELAELVRLKELSGVQDRNRLHRSTKNVAWLSAVPHHLNGIEFSWEEIRDNLLLRYGLMPQDIPATCNFCGKRFSNLSCPIISNSWLCSGAAQ